MKFKSFGYVIILLLICISLYAGSEVYEDDLDNGIERDIYNYTDTMFKWNESLFEHETYNASLSQDVIQIRLNNIIYKLFDAVGFSTFEGAKMFTEIGYNSHGEYDLGFMIKLMQFVLWVIIIGVLFYPAMIVGVGLYELFKYIRKKIINIRKERK